ncbi:hypothetical protein [Microvirga yunnanensis]|uniref:hypothetical protein n=1 Tax=Microvirga yunnanensis TaxID=2953740 RepID=UPI0021C7F4B2|nr:hypothetical protein [Microvirga sp. HBU65207]
MLAANQRGNFRTPVSMLVGICHFWYFEGTTKIVPIFGVQLGAIFQPQENGFDFLIEKSSAACWGPSDGRAAHTSIFLAALL